MEATLQLPFNNAQVEILKLFASKLSDEQLTELREVLIAFRLKILEENMAKAAKQKGYSLEKINAASHEHHRTPYRSKRILAEKQ